MTDEQLEKIPWLERAREADKSAKRLYAVYESKKAEVTALKKSYRIGDSGDSTKKNALEVKIINMLESERKWREKIDYVEIIKSEILSEINKVPNELLADILEARYIDFYTHEQTAEMFHYSVQSVKRLHKKALDILKVDTR